ncbi:MAG: branched-chain amino acid ABC transporter permease [Deltaproteobacteria bacterium]|nr:branched-chain amino acid ABC transporter permease [Deltaproteobacteria bacterium]
MRRVLLPLLVLAGFALSVAIPRYELVDKYVQLVLMYVGINVILAASLNLVNGYMGEFSVGHAGFMAVGAYTASLLTVKVFPVAWGPWVFPLAVAAGGLVAALFGLLVAIPSFKTRGDYLALVTLAFLMIVKSLIENIDVIGGPRGLLGMKKLTTLPWTFAWVALTLWILRNFVYSKYGRGVLAIREDETASELMSVRTRRVKFLAFSLSSFFAGVGGGLFAHVLQFISPRVFDIVKSTDILIMVYLGGTASLAGSVLGATLYTVLLEVLRPTAVAAAFSWLPEATYDWLWQHVFQGLGTWRMVLMPLLLVLVMLFRPRGILGMREFPLLVPAEERRPGAQWLARKGTPE